MDTKFDKSQNYGADTVAYKVKLLPTMWAILMGNGSYFFLFHF